MQSVLQSRAWFLIVDLIGCDTRGIVVSSFVELVQNGAVYGWLFVPTAVLLGALHGLEPGHSKTMMAAFIVAIRGTIGQAVLLALTATVSHTAIVWLLAILALTYGEKWGLEANEPYFQLVSAALIIGIAIWMIARTYRDQKAAKAASAHSHASSAHEMYAQHDHAHEEAKLIDTGHGIAELSVYEQGVAPRFRIYVIDKGRRGPPPTGQTVTVETIREGGVRETFAFEHRGEFLEATTTLPEPHEFEAKLILSHGGHAHVYSTRFAEHAHREHTHADGSKHSHDHGEHSHDAGTHNHAHRNEHGHAHGHPHPHEHADRKSVV